MNWDCSICGAKCSTLEEYRSHQCRPVDRMDVSAYRRRTDKTIARVGYD